MSRARVPLLLCCAWTAIAAAEPAAPYGATLTTDPTTTAAGSWEAELGVRDGDGPASLPFALKYGASAELELALVVVGEDFALQSRVMLARGGWSMALLPRLALDRDRGGDVRSASLAWLAAHAVGRGGLTINLGAVAEDGPDGTVTRLESAADLALPLGTTGWRARTSLFAGAYAARDDQDTERRAIEGGLTHRFDEATQLDIAFRREDVGGAAESVVLLNLARNLGRAAAR